MSPVSQKAPFLVTFAIQLPKRNKTKRISNLLLKRAAKSIGTVTVRRLRLLDNIVSDITNMLCQYASSQVPGPLALALAGCVQGP